MVVGAKIDPHVDGGVGVRVDSQQGKDLSGEFIASVFEVQTPGDNSNDEGAKHGDASGDSAVLGDVLSPRAGCAGGEIPEHKSERQTGQRDDQPEALFLFLLLVQLLSFAAGGPFGREASAKSSPGDARKRALS